MNQEQLQEKAEALKGEEVKVDLKTGDRLQGKLSTLRANPVNLEFSIELTDPEGRGILIPLKQINDISLA